MQDNEDLYSDGAPNAPESAGADDEKESSEGAKTAVIPKELCPDMKVGDELGLRIVRVNEGDYEVEYEPKGESEEAAPEPAKAPDEGSMASMME